jgi:hypothetical protein
MKSYESRLISLISLKDLNMNDRSIYIQISIKYILKVYVLIDNIFILIKLILLL